MWCRCVNLWVNWMYYNRTQNMFRSSPPASPKRLARGPAPAPLGGSWPPGPRSPALSLCACRPSSVERGSRSVTNHDSAQSSVSMITLHTLPPNTTTPPPAILAKPVITRITLPFATPGGTEPGLVTDRLSLCFLL